MEVADLQSELDEMASAKSRVESNAKSTEDQLNELKVRAEEANMTIVELNSAKARLTAESAAATAACEDVESKLNQLQRQKTNMASTVEELRGQVEEEQEAKDVLQRALSKSNAEVANWRSKYESDALQRMEELEDAKKKLATRLQEAEEATETALAKAASLDKSRSRVVLEKEDIEMELERATALLSTMDKKQRGFDKELGTWKSKVEELSVSLDTANSESRAFQTEMYKLRASYEELAEQNATVKRENRNLADEINDLSDQLSTGGKSLHEVVKAKKKIQNEAEQLKAALDEAEESRVLRLQLELTQCKAEVDKRLQEKDEEFESTRKNHWLAIESMQTSMDVEVKARSEAVRGKKKAEALASQLGMDCDRAVKQAADVQKTIRKLQADIQGLHEQSDEDLRIHEELREQYSVQERKLTILSAEFEETRAALESNERARKMDEAEVLDVTDRLNGLTSQNNALAGAKKKLEAAVESAKGEVEEAFEAAKASEERARKSVLEATQMSELLVREQTTVATMEKYKKTLETKVTELTTKVDEAESYALKGGRKAMAGLQDRVKEIEDELDAEQRRHGETLKNFRKMERHLKEVQFQSDEDGKNQQRLQELVAKLQAKLKAYKKANEEAESMAKASLAKFRKAAHDLEEAEERAEMAEAAISKLRTKSRFESAGSSHVVVTKTTTTKTLQ